MLIRPVFCGASPQPLRACSACAGDYEDPDRTAWTAELEEDETHAEERARTTLQVDEQGEAENEAGDEGVSDENANDDEFPAKEACTAGKEAMRWGGRSKKKQGQ
jgi:hypothetical protein